MSVEMSLRERKKERTRRVIRQEAFRLFGEQGYTETTVEQIAAAADVSPSTFFRYFPSKEQVVLADDVDPIMLEAIEAQPADLAPLDALCAAIETVFDRMPAEGLAFERARFDLIRAVPELRGALVREQERNIEIVAAALAARAGRAPADFEVRVVAGALVGALSAVVREIEFEPAVLTRVVRFLSAGMPLGPRE
ncbi:acyl-CoA-like ligand-binding transcription factor [Nocardia thailandica]|uniref:TetR family transcriptional regulator n=1 Tax=Nocardia thailandica TaxID=257275 RepID=A0ABW6PK20_9NOCA|nr:TetR family transcriptional regulator [Nocardia thailandica]